MLGLVINYFRIEKGLRLRVRLRLGDPGSELEGNVAVGEGAAVAAGLGDEAFGVGSLNPFDIISDLSLVQSDGCKRKSLSARDRAPGRPAQPSAAVFSSGTRDGSRSGGTAVLSVVPRPLLLECSRGFPGGEEGCRLGDGTFAAAWWPLGLGGRSTVVPLSEIQEAVLRLLAAHRSSGSHLAGAAAIHSARGSLRFSGDLDLFHDRESAVGKSFTTDRASLEEDGYSVQVLLSQPGFIRARVASELGSVLIDWAHDSAWRFMPTVEIEGIGHVLHPVDLAVNKVLALSGRDEPRDWIDTLYLDENFIPMGALIWAAAGKDPGLNPRMLLDLLRRKGKIHQRDMDRLQFGREIDLSSMHQQWRCALTDAESFIESRPSEEAGHLYLSGKGLFFAPKEGETYQLHAPERGGVLPKVGGSEEPFIANNELRTQLEHFFGRKIRT